MTNPPPLLVRRVVVAPLVVLLCVVLVLLSPLVFLATLAVDVLWRGGLGLTRLAAFAVTYLLFEALMIVALFLLWIASLFGFFRLLQAHYALVRAWLRVISSASVSLLGLRIEIVDPPVPRPARCWSSAATPARGTR